MSPIATLRSVWPHLTWRHHGAGLLQTYLPGTARTQRVHVWHPRLVRADMAEYGSGAKHNHRFHLRSTILHGELLHTRLWTISSKTGDHQLWQIIGASNRAEAQMVPRGRVEVFGSSIEHYRLGDVYELPKWAYHWARQPADHHDVTITLVEVRDKAAGWASLLCPYGQRPVHAFEAETDNVLLWDVLAMASAALGLGGRAA